MHSADCGGCRSAGSSLQVNQADFWDEEEAAAAAAAQGRAQRASLIQALLAEHNQQQPQQQQVQERTTTGGGGVVLPPEARAAGDQLQKTLYNAQLRRPSRPGAMPQSLPGLDVSAAAAADDLDDRVNPTVSLQQRLSQAPDRARKQASMLTGLQRPKRPSQATDALAAVADSNELIWDAEEAAAAAAASKESARLTFLAELQAEAEAQVQAAGAETTATRVTSQARSSQSASRSTFPIQTTNSSSSVANLQRPQYGPPGRQKAQEQSPQLSKEAAATRRPAGQKPGECSSGASAKLTNAPIRQKLSSNGRSSSRDNSIRSNRSSLTALQTDVAASKQLDDQAKLLKPRRPTMTQKPQPQLAAERSGPGTPDKRSRPRGSQAWSQQRQQRQQQKDATKVVQETDKASFQEVAAADTI